MLGERAREYATIISNSFRRYVHGVTPIETPTVERGVFHMSAARTSHVVASAAYMRHRLCRASRIESNSKTRSYRMTMTGATTIDSLQAIPNAHAATDAICQPPLCVERCDRIAQ